MIRNLLVTGGAGFIGANFIRYVLEETSFAGTIINLDKLTYAANPESLTDIEANFPSQYTLEVGDVADGETLERIFEEYRIDTVCHLAAESHVDRSIVDPEDFVDTNIVGTYRLLETARRFQDQLTRFHQVSTDEVYGSLPEGGYFTESTPYQPSSPYSASKASADHLVRAYYATYELPVSLSNCSNNYGPYQFPEKLIPLMLLNAYNREALPVYGDGQNVRDWLYVKDHCRALWMILQHGEEGRTYNVGGNSEYPNLDVVRLIADLVDEEAEDDAEAPDRRSLITFVKDRPGHDRRYAIDASRIQEELQWKPHVSFQEGLRHTLRWYLNNPKWVERVKSGAYREWMETHYGRRHRLGAEPS